jgi:hypothetical protein
VALGDGWLMVGAPMDDDTGSNSGSVYVYRFDGASWVQSAKLSPGIAGDDVGRALAMRGDRAVLGAPQDDTGGSGAGAAYVYVRSGSAWTQEAKLVANDNPFGDLLGNSVSMHDGVVLVGALRDDANGRMNSGSAVVFRLSNGQWSQEARLIAADGSLSDFLGTSVAIEGDTALVGAPADDNGSTNSGTIYVFRRENGVWVDTEHLHALDSAAEDRFGSALALSGGHALMTSPFDDDAGESSGSFYAFDETPPNGPPTCNAGGPYSAECQGGQSSVALDGSGSSDPNPEDALTYAWSSNCPGASFNDPTSPTPTLTLSSSPSCNVACEVTLTVHDGVNPPMSCSVNVSVTDTQPPSLSVPADLSVECDGSGNQAELNAWLAAASASDVCGAAALHNDFTGLSDECGATGAATVTWTATDACGSSVQHSATFTVVDTTPPALSAPADVRVAAGSSLDPADTGQPTVSDCDPDAAVSYQDSETRGECLADPIDRTITRAWTATDSCGNTASASQVIQVEKLILRLDIKPDDCPNSHNPRSNGVLPAVLLGSADVGGDEIDLSTIRISRSDCVGNSVAANSGNSRNYSYSRAGSSEPCGCQERGHDNMLDVKVQFDSAAMDAALRLSSANRDSRCR